MEEIRSDLQPSDELTQTEAEAVEVVEDGSMIHLETFQSGFSSFMCRFKSNQSWSFCRLLVLHHTSTKISDQKMKEMLFI